MSRWWLAMVLLGGAMGDLKRSDPAAWADARTSMCDLRAAVMMERGYSPDQLGPASYPLAGARIG